MDQAATDWAARLKHLGDYFANKLWAFNGEKKMLLDSSSKIHFEQLQSFETLRG